MNVRPALLVGVTCAAAVIPSWPAHAHTIPVLDYDVAGVVRGLDGS